MNLSVVFCCSCATINHPAVEVTSSDMRLIRGATFRMGTDLSEVARVVENTGLSSDASLQPEIPSHMVTVEDFYLDVYDVTNDDFFEFVTANSSWRRDRADSTLHNGRYLEHWTVNRPSTTIGDHPVTFVSWYAAVAYCAWRGKRLPTEDEYEWAAQDGNSRFEYPWGDAFPSDERVNWGGNGIDNTVPVGSYPPNTRGLYDMSGNVWHFTADPWVGAYSVMLSVSAPLDEINDPRIRRVVRGGSYGANAANLRVRYRDSHRPFDAREMVGFRCALSANSG